MLPGSNQRQVVLIGKAERTRKFRVWRRIKSFRQQLQYQEEHEQEYIPEQRQFHQHHQARPIQQFSSCFIDRLKEPIRSVEKKTKFAVSSANEITSKNKATEEDYQSVSMLLISTVATDIYKEKLGHETGGSANEVDSAEMRLKIRRRRKLRLRSDITLLLLLILSFSSLTIICLLTQSCLAVAPSKSNKLANHLELLDGTKLIRTESAARQEPLDKRLQIAKHDKELRVRGKRSARLESRSANDEISSADLPAEFRGSSSESGATRKEPASRLARLCEQTSSVLASVLPAPFGGHKRSVLCQFFGQVPEPEISSGVSSSTGGQTGIRLPLDQRGHLESIAILQQGRQPPVTSMLAPGKHPIQLVLEQQRLLAQRQHQQQELYSAIDSSKNVELLKGSASLLDYSYQQRLEPPVGMLHKLPGDRSEKLEQKEQLKFNPTLAAAHFKPLGLQPSSSPLLSTSGWRIFDGARSPDLPATLPEPFMAKLQPVSSNRSQIAQTSSSEALRNVLTGGSPAKIAPTNNSKVYRANLSFNSSTPSQVLTTRSDQEGAFLAARPSGKQLKRNEPVRETGRYLQHYQENPTGKGPQLLVMGKPPVAEQAMLNIAKRSQALKSTTRSSWFAGSQQTALQSGIGAGERIKVEPSFSSPVEVRTIEVLASQQMPPNGTIETSSENTGKLEGDKSAKGAYGSSLNKTVENLPQELQQNQHKREELVIASINNLTRIAFGNQLRDTVKVINKLIDEQASLFSKHLASSTTPSFILQNTPISVVGNQLQSSESRDRSKKNEQTDGKWSSMKKSDLKKAEISSGFSIKPSGSSKKLASELPTTAKLSAQQIKSKEMNDDQNKATKKPKKRPPGGESLRIAPQSLTSTTAGRNKAENLRSNQGLASGRLLAGDGTLSNVQLALVQPTRKRSVQVSSTTPGMHPTYLDIQRQDRTPWQLSSAPPTGRTSSSRLPSSQIQHQLVARTSKAPYPWLIPDRSAVSSDLFASSSLAPLHRMEQILDFSESFTKRLDSSEKPRVMIDSIKKNKFIQNNPPSVSVKKTLALNRIEGKQLDPFSSTSKQPLDSLTTLKMSLASQILGSSTSDGAQQSRWKPTTSHLQTSPTSATTITTTTTTTTTTSSTTTSTTKRPATTTPFSVTTVTASDSTADTKASDSISRYTSHWNDANQLLTSTRRLNSALPPQQSVQIAQTGEFFSAETIASWPERYQTMLGQALEGTGSTAALPSATTRRNGEVYEAKHKTSEFGNEGSPTASASTITTTFATPNPSFGNITTNTHLTMLPANHKFTSSDSEENFRTSVSSGSTSSLSTLPHTTYSTERPRYTVGGPVVAYTLVGPITGSETTQSADKSSLKDNILLSTIGSESIASLERSNSKMNLVVSSPQIAPSSLRPPYITSSLLNTDSSSDTSSKQQLREDVLLEYEGSADKPHITRKLYELLVPSTRNFVGAQNPLNHQRFNLSAMKFLAQSLLLPSVQQQNSSDLSGDIEPLIVHEAQQHSNGSTAADSWRLMELLDTSLPFSYNNLLVNEPGQVLQGIKGNNSSNNMGKSFLGRASNLLNDLKQLEHKKAAALLAAIRYQVPGPLVRPWDLATDIYNSNEANSLRLRDRLDDSELVDANHSNYGSSLGNLLTALQASNLVEAARKQRFVPRELLHARLSAHNNKYKHSTDNRAADFDLFGDRSDLDSSNPSLKGSPHDTSNYHEKTSKEPAYSFGTADNEAGIFNGSRHDDADYLASQDQTLDPQGSSVGNSTRRWLNRLFHRNYKKTQVNLTSDFDLVDPLEKAHDKLEVQPYAIKELPKYIHKTELQPRVRKIASHGLAEDHTEKIESDQTAGSLEERDKNSEVRMNNKTNLDELTKAGKKDNFDCSERQSGFYPDVETSCQTFYHCSNTGHLLTFNCPQQTRFDEKSLKCGLWYEVPCDLERIKQKRLRSTN